ncbi:MAG: hypothetical protein VYD64_06165 [Pseudomonadota bacterium]|nr:hypothetical protein [Pseudomonadota bacterium]
MEDIDVSKFDRRTVLAGTAAIASVSAIAPVLASAAPYTVLDHIEEMKAAKAPFYWKPEGVYHWVADADWDKFEEARKRAKAAGITIEDVWEALKPGDWRADA